MSLVALFGKLLEYEADAANISDFNDENNRKHRNIALKATKAKKDRPKSSSSSEKEDENLNLIVRRFIKFLSKRNPRRNQKQRRRIILQLQRISPVMEKRNKVEKKDQKAYITWD